MQANLSQNEIKNILTRLRVALNVATDTELAEVLGIKQNTISTWKTRGSLDFPLIISKCDNINLNWLFVGEGAMFRSETQPTPAPPTVVHERDPRDVALIAAHEKTIERDEELLASYRQRISDLEQGRISHTKGIGGAPSVDFPYTLLEKEPPRK